MRLCFFQLLFVCIYICTPVMGQPLKMDMSSPLKGEYHVQIFQTDMGGGGYITGIVQDVTDPDILYARSDVAGVFKSTNGGKSWAPHNRGVSKMSDHYCHSLAIDPFNEQVLLRASGDVRDFQFTGRIHRSVDGGNNWHLVKDGLDYYGNGPTRIYGELICYNPERKGEVAAGSYSKGVWLSKDGGESWTYSGLKGERISCVIYAGNCIFAGTIPDQAMGKNSDCGIIDIGLDLHIIQDTLRNSPGRMYMSADNGKNWKVLYENPELAVFEIIVTDNNQTILFASQSGVYRSVDGGRSFDLITDLPRHSKYRTLVQSGLNPDVFYAAEEFPTKYPVTIYRSGDKGMTWTALSPDCRPENLHEFPDWHGPDPKRIGAAISHILPDCKDENKLYISNWWGVTLTYDSGKNFYGHQFKGIGIMCCESLRKHPTREGVFACGICDHAPAFSTDDSKSYTMSPMEAGPARAICFSKYDPDLFLFASQSKGHAMRLYKSEDSGQTGRVVWELKGKNYIQDLKEDPLVEGRLWAYLEGDISGKVGEAPAGIYVSNDSGEHWNKVNNPCWGTIKTLPSEEFLIDRNLTPIVNYQYKNGCGTGQMIDLDAKRKDVIYVGEWTEGIFRSDDAGNNWIKVSEALPFGKEKHAVLSLIYADPYQSGVVYAGFWKYGLWKSTDYGKTWCQLSPLDLMEYNASSFSISKGQKGQTLMAIACSNHLCADTPTMLLITENGRDWTDIYDESLGCMRWISVIADADKQKVYGATAGSGIYYFEINK